MFKASSILVLKETKGEYSESMIDELANDILKLREEGLEEK